ncbi:MAG: ABC transporter permease [Cyanobacteria bacterium P01_F01_bin.143]
MIASTHLNERRSRLKWHWELLYVLVRRNLKKRYRGSFLGIYWSLLNPIIMTILYSAVFGTAFAVYYDDSILNYVLAVFTGLIIFNFFSASTAQALASVVANGSIVNKIKLPLFIFPLSCIGANIFQFVMGGLPLLMLVTLILSKNILNVLAIIFPLLALALVCTGVGFLTGALYVFFRDLPYFYELLTFLIWISLPIFYPPEIVPNEIRPVLVRNPLFPIIESIRQISLSGDLPNITLIFHSLFSGCIVLTLGAIAFKLWQEKFMDLL